MEKDSLFYGYMASDIWLRTTRIARADTHCCHYISYSFRLAARGILYAPSHRQDCTYHILWYASYEAQAGTKNRSMQWRSKVPKSGGAHRHVIYVPSVKNQYKRVVIGYMVIY